MARDKQSGRIHPHQRRTDDETPIIVGDAIDVDHAAAAHNTHSKGMKPKTRREHRNRQQRVYVWLSTKYPTYYEKGTCALDDAQKNDTNNYYHKNDRDFIYPGMNADYIIAYFVSKKVKDNGNHVSPSDLSKYNDAIKWGAKVAGQNLPMEYYTKMDTFMSAYKKEYAEAKKEGKVDERAADPITASLFTLICGWALEEMNIFVWVFSLLMWHLMARSISVSSLALHNIKRGTAADALAFKYDDSKMDQTGEFVQEKNCYANPETPLLCLFTALGCYMSINSESFATTEKLFVKTGSKDGSASQTYCRQLGAIVSRNKDAAKKFLRISRFHAHGIRKGSGTHSSSATTVPPAFTSVAARGEWSMGKILDIYFQFALGGDYYLGRLLTLICPESTWFNSLPPHWKDEEHPNVRRAIEMTFGQVVSSHEMTEHDPCGILSFFLASMVHHSDWLFEQIEKHPGHPFSNIPILNDRELLKELKEQHLTLEPTATVKSPTGIPPFVTHNQLLRDVMQLCVTNNEALSAFKDDLKEAVAEAVDAKVAAEGGVNRTILNQEVCGMRDEILQAITAASQNGNPRNSNATLEEEPRMDGAVRTPRPNEFQYKDARGFVHFSSIPASFTFSRDTKRWDGWRLWLCGQIFIDGSNTFQLKPFRNIEGKELKAETRRVFDLEWKPIFKKMMEALGDETLPSTITEDFIRSSYNRGTSFLKENYSYIFFQKSDDVVSKYTLGTWSKKIKPSEVRKHGTEQDKQKLAEPTAYNKPKKRKERAERTVRSERRFTNKVISKVNRANVQQHRQESEVI